MAPQINELDQIAYVAEQAAIAAGELLRKGFYTEIEKKSKSSLHDVVTIYDTQAETLIFSHIREKYPDSLLLGEESGFSEIPSDKLTWIVDPLDGTINFSRKIPIFTVSIGVVYDEEVICGVIYDPMTNELFIAKKGQGVYLNGEKIKVSNTQNIEEGVYAIGFPYVINGTSTENTNFYFNLLNQGIPLRNIGSGALNLAYVAAGRYDGFWIPALYSWDLCAGKLMIEESGGKVTKQNGTALPSLITTDSFDMLATNGILHSKILEAFNKKKL